jgi:hypothetical protein
VAVKHINQTPSRRRPSGRRKLKIAKGGDKVMSLCDARRLKKSKESGDKLKGRGYPDDHLVGYDEPVWDHDLTDPFYGIFGLGLGMPVGPHDPKGVGDK